MTQESKLKSPVALFVFLALFGILFIVLITSFREINTGSAVATQSSTPIMTSSTSPVPDITQTAAAIITSKAMLETAYFATTHTPVTPIYLKTGIYDDQRVKISASLLFIDAQNAYGGFNNGYRYAVYAGALQTDPDQGVVALITNLPDGKRFEQLLTPSKHGALHVVSEQNNRLTLLAADGETFYFDVPARRFVASLIGVVPTATPYPTHPPHALLSSTPVPAPLPYPVPGTQMPDFNLYPMPVEPGSEAP